MGYAQASLEYLLILAVFFSCFLLLLNPITSAVRGFLFASDDLLAKSISQDVAEQASLFAFLSDGSFTSMEYSPASKIVVRSFSKEVFFGSGGREYSVSLPSQQVIPVTEFSSRFLVEIRKADGLVEVRVRAGDLNAQ